MILYIYLFKIAVPNKNERSFDLTDYVVTRWYRPPGKYISNQKIYFNQFYFILNLIQNCYCNILTMILQVKIINFILI